MEKLELIIKVVSILLSLGAFVMVNLIGYYAFKDKYYQCTDKATVIMGNFVIGFVGLIDIAAILGILVLVFKL